MSQETHATRSYFVNVVDAVCHFLEALVKLVKSLSSDLLKYLFCFSGRSLCSLKLICCFYELFLYRFESTSQHVYIITHSTTACVHYSTLYYSICVHYYTLYNSTCKFTSHSNYSTHTLLHTV